MNNNGLKIDFSQSIDDVIALLERLFDAIEKFFKTLFNLDIFAPSEKVSDGDANV